MGTDLHRFVAHLVASSNCRLVADHIILVVGCPFIVVVVVIGTDLYRLVSHLVASSNCRLFTDHIILAVSCWGSVGFLVGFRIITADLDFGLLSFTGFCFNSDCFPATIGTVIGCRHISCSCCFLLTSFVLTSVVIVANYYIILITNQDAIHLHLSLHHISLFPIVTINLRFSFTTIHTVAVAVDTLSFVGFDSNPSSTTF